MNAGSGIFGGDTGAVLARHHELLAKQWQRRALEIGGPIGIAASIVFSVWWLGISFAQIGPGLVELWKFVRLMIPPSAGLLVKLRNSFSKCNLPNKNASGARISSLSLIFIFSTCLLAGV